MFVGRKDGVQLDPYCSSTSSLRFLDHVSAHHVLQRVFSISIEYLSGMSDVDFLATGPRIFEQEEQFLVATVIDLVTVNY